MASAPALASGMDVNGSPPSSHTSVDLSASETVSTGRLRDVTSIPPSSLVPSRHSADSLVTLEGGEVTMSSISGIRRVRVSSRTRHRGRPSGTAIPVALANATPRPLATWGGAGLVGNRGLSVPKPRRLLRPPTTVSSLGAAVCSATTGGVSASPLAIQRALLTCGRHGGSVPPCHHCPAASTSSDVPGSISITADARSRALASGLDRWFELSLASYGPDYHGDVISSSRSAIRRAASTEGCSEAFWNRVPIFLLVSSAASPHDVTTLGGLFPTTTYFASAHVSARD